MQPQETYNNKRQDHIDNTIFTILGNLSIDSESENSSSSSSSSESESSSKSEKYLREICKDLSYSPEEIAIICESKEMMVNYITNLIQDIFNRAEKALAKLDELDKSPLTKAPTLVIHSDIEGVIIGNQNDSTTCNLMFLLGIVKNMEAGLRVTVDLNSTATAPQEVRDDIMYITGQKEMYQIFESGFLLKYQPGKPSQELGTDEIWGGCTIPLVRENNEKEIQDCLMGKHPNAVKYFWPAKESDITSGLYTSGFSKEKKQFAIKQFNKFDTSIFLCALRGNKSNYMAMIDNDKYHLNKFIHFQCEYHRRIFAEQKPYNILEKDFTEKFFTIGVQNYIDECGYTQRVSAEGKGTLHTAKKCLDIGQIGDIYQKSILEQQMISTREEQKSNMEANPPAQTNLVKRKPNIQFTNKDKNKNLLDK